MTNVYRLKSTLSDSKRDVWPPTSTDPSPPWNGVSKIWAEEGETSPPEAPVAWSQSPLEEQTTSSGGALEGSTYGVLNGNIRIAVPKDWAAGEVGTIALEWAPEGGSQRLVAYVQTTYEETKDAPATVNLVKFEVQTGGPANGP